MAEVQALLDDHVAGGKHSAADLVAKAQAVLTEPELLRAMFDVGTSRRTRSRQDEQRRALTVDQRAIAARNAGPITSMLLWRVPVPPPTSQYAGAALIQGRNPQAIPRLGVLL